MVYCLAVIHAESCGAPGCHCAVIRTRHHTDGKGAGGGNDIGGKGTGTGGVDGQPLPPLDLSKAPWVVAPASYDVDVTAELLRAMEGKLDLSVEAVAGHFNCALATVNYLDPELHSCGSRFSWSSPTKACSCRSSALQRVNRRLWCSCSA